VGTYSIRGEADMMKVNKRFVIGVLATASLVLSVAVADAGAVYRRYTTAEEQDEKTLSTQKRYETDPTKPLYKPNDKTSDKSAGKTSDKSGNKHEDRDKRDGRDNDRDNNRRSTRDSDQSETRDWRNREPLPFTGKVGPSVPVTPTYSRSESDRNRWNDGRRDGGDRHYDRDDDKYQRNDERRVKAPVAHRTSGRGYYYYDEGWPSHYNYPCNYGYWQFGGSSGCRKSLYYYYGYFPYVTDSRVIVVARERYYYEIPVVIQITNTASSGYYLERPATDTIEAAIADIRLAWINRDSELLMRHVGTSGERVDVVLDGKYSYSLDSDDYAAMTRDAVNTTQTVGFTLESVRKRGELYVFYGKHEFYGVSGEWKVAYVSYVLEKRAGTWVITEVGSSMSKLWT
jgi:hypothetical protein